MPWTPRQADAIESRNETLLVSAAAGSGKTAVLVERVITLILQDQIGLDRMLIVTFTNAAASEMKEKINKRIRAALAEPSASEETRKYLRHQLSLMGSAHISTFHSFAAEIIRRYYHVIGVKPQLAIADESRQELLKAEAMNELFEAMFEAEDPHFKALMDSYATARDDSPVRNLILQFSRFLASLPDPIKWAQDLSAGKLTDTELLLAMAKEDIRNRLGAALGNFESCKPYFLYGADGMGLPPTENLAQKNAVDAEYVRGLLQDLDIRPLEETIGLAAAFKAERMTARKDEKASWEYIKEDVTALRDSAKDLLKRLSSDYLGFSEKLLALEKDALLAPLESLCLLTLDFEARYREKKLAKGLMDFSDMEHYALQILENQQVCEEYRSTFDYVFIDEYQDSNMVQEQLIARVSRPDNLFMVGDVKQSIYKFRLAEPELFLSKYQRFKAEEGFGRVIDLNANFRSKRSVIDFVNELFAVIMNPATCSMVYDEDASLEEGSPYTGDLSYPPQLYLIDSKAEKKEDAPEGDPDDAASAQLEELKAADLEALEAVRILKSYVGKPIYDSKAGCERPLSYKDMVILLPVVKNKGEIYYRTLAAAGIPVYLERSEGYFDTLEVQVFLNLLKLINNYKNDLALISVLHFPAFGFTVEELAEIRLFGIRKEAGPMAFSKAFRLYGEEGTDEALKERCQRFFEQLSGWKKAAAYRPLGDFVWRLLSESGMMDCCLGLPGGIQRQANLRVLADKAEAFEAESSAGLYGFVTYIEAVKGSVSVGEAEVFSEDADAVRIMTIHKSKGLEFPFVLVGGMQKSFTDSGSAPILVSHKQLGCAVTLANPKTGLEYKPFIYRLIRLRHKKEELAEHIRLLYVAATRAKDILIFTGSLKNAPSAWKKFEFKPSDGSFASSYLELLHPAFPEGEGLHYVSREMLEQQAPAPEEESDLAQQLRSGFVLDEKDLAIDLNDLRERLSYSVELKEDESSKTKYSVSQLAELSHLDENEVLQAPDFRDRFKAPSFADPKKQLDSAARGTAYHTVMEHIPFTAEEKSPEDVARFMDSLLAGGILTEPQRNSVDPAKIARFFVSETGRRVVSSERVLKEAPFTIRREYKGRTIMVMGTLDCCFLEDGQWVLVDYKSNYIDRSKEAEEMERLRRTYKPQLEEYRYALETITGIPVKEAVLYLFGTDKELIIE